MTWRDTETNLLVSDLDLVDTPDPVRELKGHGVVIEKQKEFF